ncbi:unnamed protein product [Alopecurus aequalis]
MPGDDRLSNLPDDLLRRVLYFAPAREAQSTSALSRRWRGLCCSTGAVNLHESVPEDVYDVPFFSRRDAFVSAARLSLEAAAADGIPVTRFTFHLEPARHINAVHKFLHSESDWRSRSTDVVSELLSLPATRRVQELRLAAEYSGHDMSLDREIRSLDPCFDTLEFTSLPSETLRVLDIASCSFFRPAASVAFPRLASLRLSRSSISSEHLEDFVHAAPVLATVHLESVMFHPPPEEQRLTIRLHFPAATVLVLDKCSWGEKIYDGSSGTTALEIDAPRLRRFTYKGLLRRLSLSRQAPDLAQIELHILPFVYRGRHKDARHDLVKFWRILHNFSNTRELKLRVDLLQAIAVVSSASRAELLCSFRNLERLELEGRLAHNEKAAAVSIANLLQCCPMLRDLRINLTTSNANMDTCADQGRCYLEKKYRQDLHNSIHGCNNRTSIASADYDHDGDAILQDKYLSKLPAALTRHVFQCLQSSLTCVRLQFRLETRISRVKLTKTFGVKLIKFFAENAMLLKEMLIDAGNEKMCGHINSKVQKWASGKSFLVLPLERR